MRRPAPLRNLLERRRALLEEALSDAPIVDISRSILPIFGPTPGTVATRHPLPLIDRALDFFRGVRPRGRVRSLAAQREQARDLPRGAPLPDVTVQPVWDSRLVNMRDFLATLESTGEGPVNFPATVTLEYPVPQGYTGFLRGFRYFFDPPASGTPPQFRATLLVDDLIVPDFIAMPFGPMMSDYQDTFVIGRAGQSFRLQLVITAPGPFATTLHVFFYGNLRLTDGRPAYQDVGERIRQQPVVVAPPPPAPVPVPDAPLVCPPGQRLMRVTVNGREEMRCMTVLGQAKRK